MSLLKKLFGASSGEKGKPNSYRERDNRGTRQDTESMATGYWMARISMPKKDPFVLYAFETERDAREALLELPCIHVAEDSGRLICTEVLLFGYYATKEGTYEAIICGEELTHELWEQAKASFIRHGGRPRGQGELEPEKRAVSAPKPKAAKPGKVVFVREERKTMMGATLVYRIHRGPDSGSAMEFLQQNPVTKQFYYLVVETPEGNFCRDIQGIYKE